MKIGILVTISVIVIAGILLWAHDMHIGLFTLQTATSTPTNLVASPIRAIDLSPAPAVFDETGTVVIDDAEGPAGTAFLLYTTYNRSDKPAIRTKRLVFPNDSACSAGNLPCAAAQGELPVSAVEQLHVVGTLRDDTVLVERYERL